MDYNTTAGQELRRLRQKYGLTLHEAADRMLISASVLSRRERGVEPSRREDIQSAITAYRLTEEEACSLWMAAGFIPDPKPTAQQENDQHAHIECLLHDLALPTLVLDTLCYIRAWTQEIEALGLLGPGASTDDRLHIIDCLFSATLRDTLGSHWDSLTTQFIRIFYQRTLRVANDPTFRDLLQHLHRQYGEPFLSKWNRAYDEGPERETGLSPTLPTFQQHSDYGIIRYILAHRSFAHPLSYQMITCIPYDAHSLAHYQQLYAATDARKIYYQG